MLARLPAKVPRHPCDVGSRWGDSVINMERYRTLSVLGSTVALSAALLALFALCGLGEMLGGELQVTHMWISLLTAAPITAAQGWLEGLFFSLAFGMVAGSVFAGVHNAVAARRV